MLLIYSPASDKINKKTVSKIVFEIVSFGVKKKYWTITQRFLLLFKQKKTNKFITEEILKLCAFLGEKTIERNIFIEKTPKTEIRPVKKPKIAETDFWALSIATLSKKPSPESLFSTSNEFVTFSRSLENVFFYFFLIFSVFKGLFLIFVYFRKKIYKEKLKNKFFDDATHIFESVIRTYGTNDFFRYKQRKSGPFLSVRSIERQISEDIKSEGKANFFFGEYVLFYFYCY